MGSIIHDLVWDSSTGVLYDIKHILTRERVSWGDPDHDALPWIIDPEPLEDYTQAGVHYGMGNAATVPGSAGHSNDTHQTWGPWKPGIKRHTTGEELTLTFQQQYQYSDDGGQNWRDIPNAAYTITRRATANGDQTVTFSLTKSNDTIGLDHVTSNWTGVP
jgi:hypothetical protein